MNRSCLNCKFCEAGYEHSKVCVHNPNKPIYLIFPYDEAEACAVYKEYNRWDINEI